MRISLPISFLITLFLLGNVKQSAAQKKLSQGKVTFDITYPETELDEKTLAMMPTESVIFFKNQMSRTEMNTGMGATVVIADGKTGLTTMLMDMMGSKIAMKTTKEDIEKEKKKSGTPKVKITGETKTIAGYLCKKAEITLKLKDSSEVVMNAYFTKDIQAVNSMRTSMNESFEGIDGFMMEYQTQMDVLNMKMKCRTVEEINVSDSLFAIPSGYTVTTMEDLINLKVNGR